MPVAAMATPTAIRRSRPRRAGLPAARSRCGELAERRPLLIVGVAPDEHEGGHRDAERPAERVRQAEMEGGPR